MNIYIIIALTYTFIGTIISFAFFFIIKKKSLKSFWTAMLVGVIGSFFGGFLSTVIQFDPLKYIPFFRDVFRISIFLPVIFSVLTMITYIKAVENN